MPCIRPCFFFPGSGKKIKEKMSTIFAELFENPLSAVAYSTLNGNMCVALTLICIPLSMPLTMALLAP